MHGSSVYAATKAAVRSLVRTGAAELADAGVRVNAVSPGPVETPLYGKLGMSADVVQGFAKSLIEQIPLKRFGRPEEIARAMLFLASDDASFMTGEEIVVDGGMTRV
jgi:NAD(P)-dependent dehydrogenase (short-subunit alcohol dehydrogenase family)